MDFICNELEINSEDYWVCKKKKIYLLHIFIVIILLLIFFFDNQLLLSLPSTSNNQVLEGFIDYVLSKMKMKGINICNESMLCLYAHDSHTGIVLDCGDRIQIAPFTDG